MSFSQNRYALLRDMLYWFVACRYRKTVTHFCATCLVAGASAALAHALAALHALVSLAWGRGGAAAGLVGGAAGKRDKRRENGGKQIS